MLLHERTEPSSSYGVPGESTRSAGQASPRETTLMPGRRVPRTPGWCASLSCELEVRGPETSSRSATGHRPPPGVLDVRTALRPLHVAPDDTDPLGFCPISSRCRSPRRVMLVNAFDPEPTTTILEGMLALTLTLALLQAPVAERGIGVEGQALDTAPSSTTYGRRHALVVGIDAYEDPAYPDLGYAVADAQAVAKILIEKYGFAPDDVRLILNEDATRDALDEALEEWACDPERVSDEDLLVVFFAGHGVTRELGGRGSRGYLVPVDGRADAQATPAWSSLLGMNDLEDVSEAIPAKHRTVHARRSRRGTGTRRCSTRAAGGTRCSRVRSSTRSMATRTSTATV